ncbi:MAG: hypothetical protein ACD_71C00018G0001 [uncultured bacterium (gcode 4)]|uniref:Uncharacterized protein n=1 Tax=uncultured bacterium (gcode 4) TaxID=1234023 RepID=K1Z5H6_9BACT|nr:MAG: hypothetical protein ACD_71C00018G0001 [uncultured bacterium (gcode 4)]
MIPLVQIDDIDPKSLSSLKFFYWIKEKELFRNVIQIPVGEWKKVYFSSYMTGGHEDMLDLLLEGVDSEWHVRIFLWDSTIWTTSMAYPFSDKEKTILKQFTDSFKSMLSKLEEIKWKCPRMTVYFNNANHSKFLIVDNEWIFTSQNYWAWTFHSIESWVYFKTKDESIIHDHFDNFETDFMSNQNTILLFWLRWKSNLIEIIDIDSFKSALTIIEKLLQQVYVGIDDTNYVPETEKWYDSIDTLYNEVIDPFDKIDAFLSEINFFKWTISIQKSRASAYNKFGLSFNKVSSTTQYFNTLNEFEGYLNSLYWALEDVKEILDHGQLSDIFDLLDWLHWESLYANWVNDGDINWDYLEEVDLLQEDCLEESPDSPGEPIFDENKYLKGLNELKEKYSNYSDLTEPPTPDDLNDYFMYHVFPKASEEIIDQINNHEWYNNLLKLKDKLEEIVTLMDKIDSSNLDIGSTLFV